MLIVREVSGGDHRRYEIDDLIDFNIDDPPTPLPLFPESPLNFILIEISIT